LNQNRDIFLSVIALPINERPALNKSLDGWEPQALMDRVLPILDGRRASNDGIDSYGPLAKL